MRISRAGTFSKEGGFTLIELLVVLAIIGLVAVMTAPRLMGFIPRGVEASSQSIARMADRAAAEAALYQVEARLVLDLDAGRYGMETPVKQAGRAVEGASHPVRQVSLPIGEGVRINAVETASGVVRRGRIALRFLPWGARDSAVVQLADDVGRVYSVILNPLGGRTEIMDGEVRLAL